MPLVAKIFKGGNVREIKRDAYLQKLINRKENGLIKVLTGIRRCGKSYLLNPIFKDYLIGSGVKEDHIIKLELDREENRKYRDPHALNEFIKSQIKDKKMHYLLLDEIQLVDDFESLLNSFLYEKNVYPTEHTLSVRNSQTSFSGFILKKQLNKNYNFIVTSNP